MDCSQVAKSQTKPVGEFTTYEFEQSDLMRSYLFSL
jgi:hypothetical protein